MNNLLKLDWITLVVIFLLIGMGLVALYSVSFVENKFETRYFQKQIIAIVIGIGLMAFLSFYDYRAIDFYSTKLYFAILAVLAAVIFWGVRVRGTVGWIGFGDFNIQPVEIAKLVLIIFLASFLSKKKTKLSILTRTITSIILVFLPIFLVLQQPDFGSAAIIVAIWVGMLAASGLNRK
ncbi:MAG: FtsW/RodA/SpoVE family cell cycle protein, partial [Patescibacteria group bacterium]